MTTIKATPITLAAATLLSIAACDSGVIDGAVRQGVRQSAVQACGAWLPQSDLSVAAGIDPVRLCSCAVDRILANKSASEVADLRPTGAELRAAAARCLVDLRTARDGSGSGMDGGEG